MVFIIFRICGYADPGCEMKESIYTTLSHPSPVDTDLIWLYHTFTYIQHIVIAINTFHLQHKTIWICFWLS